MTFQAGYIIVHLEMLAVIFINLRIQGIADRFLAHDFFRFITIIIFLNQMLFDGFKINWWERFTRAVCQRFNVFQNDFLKLLRESAVRLSHHTLEVGDDRIRIRKSGTCSQDVFFCQAIFKHKDGQITNSFRSRSNFYDISKQIIGIFV